MFDDEKIKLIEAVPEADMILVIWIKLLTLAGKKNMNGYIFLTENIPYTDEMLATIFNRPINTIRLALETFKNFGMINYNGEGQIKITNWEKHQNIEGLERIKELARARQSKYMERKKQKALMNNDVITTSNDDTRLELDKIREDKIRLEGNVTNNVTNTNNKSNEFISVFNDFKEMRIKIRKPMTLKAEELLLKKLDKFSCNVTEQIEILEQSIMNSWQGVFPLKDKPKMTMEEALARMEVKE